MLEMENLQKYVLKLINTACVQERMATFLEMK